MMKMTSNQSEEAIFLAFFNICKALETIKSIDMNSAMCIAWGILMLSAIHLLLKHAMGNNQKPKDIYRWGLIVWYADPKENSTEWNF